MNKACYRKLKRYKYQLMEPYNLKIGIEGYSADSTYVKLDTDYLPLIGMMIWAISPYFAMFRALLVFKRKNMGYSSLIAPETND